MTDPTPNTPDAAGLDEILQTIVYEDIHAKWARHDDTEQEFVNICYAAAVKAKVAIRAHEAQAVRQAERALLERLKSKAGWYPQHNHAIEDTLIPLSAINDELSRLDAQAGTEGRTE